MNETGQGIRDWMRRIEGDLARLDSKLDRTAIGFERTIKSEIAEIKTEAIADLRKRVDEGYRTLERFDDRLRGTENTLRDLNTGRKIVGGLSHFIVGLTSAIAAYFGAKHL